MTLNDEQIDFILKNIFIKNKDRNLVRAVVYEGMTCYRAEKMYSISRNTGIRRVTKYKDHIAYLKRLDKLG